MSLTEKLVFLCKNGKREILGIHILKSDYS